MVMMNNHTVRPVAVDLLEHLLFHFVNVFVTPMTVVSSAFASSISQGRRCDKHHQEQWQKQVLLHRIHRNLLSITWMKTRE
jgi:hypothetical protein